MTPKFVDRQWHFPYAVFALVYRTELNRRGRRGYRETEETDESFRCQRI
ncbi:hypothetical protein [Microcoleus sp. T2B6]